MGILVADALKEDQTQGGRLWWHYSLRTILARLKETPVEQKQTWIGDFGNFTVQTIRDMKDKVDNPENLVLGDYASEIFLTKMPDHAAFSPVPRNITFETGYLGVICGLNVWTEIMRNIQDKTLAKREVWVF